MGKKGKVGRLKRKPAPRFWPIHRKETIWIVRPSSGPHSLEKCLPLSIVLRDILKVAETRKEAKKIITQGKVYVDGKVRLEDDFPVGLMDVISMPDLNKFYRILPSHKGLFLNPISKEEASFKLFRIEDKTIVKNGNSQFALHDGTNMLVKAEDPDNPAVVYETFATLKLGLPEKQVLGQLKTEKGNIAIITGGKNIGKQGKIVEIEKTVAKKRRNALVVVEDEKGDRYQTILDFVFSVGGAKSLISLSEADSLV
ncbi:30S ribosomal protein S4e [Candidatus Bathyarchaeota archaeon]|nr:30S ribosomal protein S4e [Candidatus Bathyarchaeota archaeon]TRO48157.1 30S ribosomal protein S4e [Candidatus Bathyarchaeota archaeon]